MLNKLWGFISRARRDVENLNGLTPDQILAHMQDVMFDFIRNPDNPSKWCMLFFWMIVYADLKLWQPRMLASHTAQKVAVMYPYLERISDDTPSNEN